MIDRRLKIWQTLLTRALGILDGAMKAGLPPDDWSFGGGTVLMLEHRHRFSKDIDIFLSDAQYLGLVSPRLCDRAEQDMSDYVEQSGFVKIYYDEGEIDFVVANALTSLPFSYKTILGRTIKVETPLEIVGKKIYHRAADFKARDIFDVALVLERHDEARQEISRLLRENSAVLLERLERMEVALREDFAAIDVIEYRPTYDECVSRLKSAMTV